MALPVSLSGITWSATGQFPFYCGPFLSSGGNVYGIFVSSTASTISVQKATDPTSSFSEAATTTWSGGATCTSLDVKQVGNVLHLVYSVAGIQDIHYRALTMDTDSWVAADELVDGGADGYRSAVSLHVRSTGDLILETGIIEKIKGTPYDRTVYHIKSGTWTLDTYISPNGTPETNHYPSGIVVAGASDRSHFFYKGDTSSPYPLYHRSLSGSTLDTIQTVDSDTTGGGLSIMNQGPPGASYGTSPVNIRVAYADAGGASAIDKASTVKFESGATPTLNVDAKHSDRVIYDPGGGSGASVPLGTVNDGTTVYVIYVDTTDKDLYFDKNVNDAGWGTDTLMWSGTGNINAVCPALYTRSGTKVIAAFYLDGTTVKYNEYSLVTAPTAKAGSDSSAVVASEVVNTVSGRLTGTDTTALAVTEVVSRLFATVAASDTDALSVTEVERILRTVLDADTAALTASETMTLLMLSTLAGADTAAHAMTETAALLGALLGIETASVTVTPEASDLRATLAISDDTALTATEAASLFAALASADVAALTTDEAASLLAALAASDAGALVAAAVGAVVELGVVEVSATDLTALQALAVVSALLGQVTGTDILPLRMDREEWTPALVASDDFNRADGSPGANWLQLSTTATLEIVSQRVKQTAVTGVTGHLRWQGAGSFTDDHFSTVTLQELLYPGGIAGVIVRASTDQDATRDYYFAHVEATASQAVRVGKLVNGTVTDFIYEPIGGWVNGDTLTLQVLGAELRALRNGVLLWTGTDTELTTGNPGVQASGSGGSGPSVDDWIGGSVTVAPWVIGLRVRASLAESDNPAVVLATTAAVLAHVAGVDLAAVSVAEAQSIVEVSIGLIAASDTTLLGLTEAVTSLAASIATADTTAITTTELAALAATIQAAVSAPVSVTDLVAALYASLFATDTGALDLIEAAAALQAQFAQTDTTPVTATGTATTVAASLLGSDAPTVTVTDAVSALAASLLVADACAISVSAAESLIAACAEADLTSVVVSAAPTVQELGYVVITGSDSTSVVVTAAGTISQIGVAGVDLVAIVTAAATDARAALAVAESLPVAVTEASLLAVTVLGTDLAAVTVSTATDFLQSLWLASSDTVAIATAETGAAVDVTGTASIWASASVAIGLIEVASALLGYLATQDTAAVVIVPTGAARTLVTSTDAVAIGLTDLARDLLANLTDTDAAALAATEVAQTIAALIQAAESVSIEALEVTGSALFVAGAATVPLSVSAQDAIQEVKAGLDAAALQVSESWRTLGLLLGSDNLPLEVLEEIGTIFAAVREADAVTVVLDDVARIFWALEASDLVQVHVLDAGSLYGGAWASVLIATLRSLVPIRALSTTPGGWPKTAPTRAPAWPLTVRTL